MLDSWLGQAGFGEQIQLYGDTFWRQLGSTLLWTFLVIWGVLVVVAIGVALFRRVDVTEDMRSARELDEVLLARRTGPPTRHKAA